MSNATLVKRISEAALAFEANALSFASLREIVESTASAIESLPYTLVLELRDIQSRLAAEQAYRDEGHEDKTAEVVARLREWLQSVPV